MANAPLIVVGGAPGLADALSGSGAFPEIVTVGSARELISLITGARMQALRPTDVVFLFSDTMTEDDPTMTLPEILRRLTGAGYQVIVAATTSRGIDLQKSTPKAGLLVAPVSLNDTLFAIGAYGYSVDPVDQGYAEIDITRPLPAAPPNSPGSSGSGGAGWTVPGSAGATESSGAGSASVTPEAPGSFAAPATPAVPESAPPAGTPEPAGAPPAAPAAFAPPASAPAAFAPPTPEPAFAPPASAPAAFAPPTPPTPEPAFAPPASAPTASAPPTAPSAFAPPASTPSAFAPPAAPAAFAPPASAPAAFAPPTPEPAFAPPASAPTAFAPPGGVGPGVGMPGGSPATDSAWGAPSGYPGASVAPRMGTAPAHSSMGSAPRRGYVVTIAVSKGGVGKSSMTLNLAAFLGMRLRSQGKTVCVIDANFQQADSGKYLDTYTPNINTIVNNPSLLTKDRILEALVHKPEYNLSVLLGPATPDEGNPLAISARLYNEILDLIRQHYDYVLIDTPVAEKFHEMFSDFALPRADYLIVPVAPNFTTLHNADNWLRSAVVAPRNLGGAGLDPNRVGIVLNRAEDGIGCSEEDVRQTMASWHFLGAIPETKEWKACNNRNELVAPRNYAELSQAFAEVMHAATAEPVLIENLHIANGKSGGIGGKLRGLFRRSS